MRNVALLLGLICASSPVSAQELLTNGDFESGFTGWVRADQTGSDGTFFIDAPGTGTPSNDFATAPNAGGGALYAVTDAQGPGSHVLTQTFTVPVGTTALMLSLGWN